MKCWLISLVLLSACTAAPSELRPPPSAPETILLFAQPGARLTALRIDAESSLQDAGYQLGEQLPIELFALQYDRCTDLAEAGYQIAADYNLLVTRERIRMPDRILRSVFDGDSQTAWEGVDELPAPVTDRLGLKLQAPTPCLAFDGGPIDLLPGATVGVTLALDERSVLVQDGDELLLMHDDGQLEPFTATVEGSNREPPNGAAFLDESGLLWLYGGEKDGRLWSGPKGGGVFTEHPPNPFWRACESDPSIFAELGRQYALTGRIGSAGTLELYAVGNGGALVRFDTATDRWIEPPVVPPEDVQPDETCPFSRSSLIVTDQGDVIALNQRREYVVRYDPETDQTFEELNGGMTSLGWVDGFGALAGNASGEVFRRERSGNWTLISNFPVFSESIRVISSYNGAVFFGGQSGRVAQFYPGYGLCETPVFEGAGISVEKLTRLGEDLVAAPLWLPIERVAYHRYRPKPQTECDAPYP